MEGDEDRLPVPLADGLLRFGQRDWPSRLWGVDDVVGRGWLSGGLHVSRSTGQVLGSGRWDWSRVLGRLWRRLVVFDGVVVGEAVNGAGVKVLWDVRLSLSHCERGRESSRRRDWRWDAEDGGFRSNIPPALYSCGPHGRDRSEGRA